VYWLAGLSRRGTPGAVLYVGRATNLRRRLAAYRNLSPENAPPALARLLSRVVEIRWQVTPDVHAAGLLEAELLQQYRPPGNRLGTHPESRWFAGMWVAADRLTLARSAEPLASGQWFGPFTRRHAFATLLRCLRRTFHPRPFDWPLGWWAPPGPTRAEFVLPPANPNPVPEAPWQDLLRSFWLGESAALLDRLAEPLKAATNLPHWEVILWQRDLTVLTNFYRHVTTRLGQIRHRFHICAPHLSAAQLEQLLALQRTSTEARRRLART
jgi:hypothetical protein